MPDYKNTALNHLKGFAKAFISLLKHNKYDVIVAPADSGSAMIVFAEITAQAANLNLPRTLILPIFSNNPGEAPFNNESLIQKIQENASLERNYTNILYLNDEIRSGHDYTICMSLLKKAGKIPDEANSTILAAGDGNIWEYHHPEITTDFFPFAINPHVELNSPIFKLLPDYIIQDFQDKVDMRLSQKEVICLLFSMPLKDLVATEPYLNYELLERAERRMPRLAKYQSQWIELTARTISQAIAEHKYKERIKQQQDIRLGKLLLGF